ncbi:MAG: CinA family nicotinamide mononucleotide deamidase-related protein [Planctomycetota bacterium]
MTDPKGAPSPHRTAALVSIGDELALGQTLDTNTQWMSDRLFALGVRTVEHVTVEDDTARITDVFRRLAAEVDLMIVTGGLGPTADDVTRDALAAALNDQLTEDQDALEAVRAWFAGRGTDMPAGNAVQALRPTGGECLPNAHGTAPGLFARDAERGCDVFCLPGPPREMTPMFESAVEPRIRREAHRAFGARAVLCFGLGESVVAERLGTLMDRDREGRGEPVVGTTASRMVVSVRLRHTAENEQAVRTTLNAVEADVNARLGPAVFGRRDFNAGDAPDLADALPEAVVAQLNQRRERVVVVESCTGGLLGELLTSVPGSSDVFGGGWLTYSDAAKAGLVGVDAAEIETHGAVSAQVALGMARGGLFRAGFLGGAHHSLAITGIAGPGGGTDDKPAGTVWIARASVTETGSVNAEARSFRFRGGRAAVREWSARSALGILRLHLVGDEMSLLGETI